MRGVRDPAEDSADENDQQLSFDEFKVYYQSTELVTDRRIATTRWNYSVGVAILGGIALLINWALSNAQFLALGLTSAALLAAVATVFSYLWLRQIDDYKSLNNAKFEVLNEMAPRLRFADGSESGSLPLLQSYKPFLREWRKLADAKALVEVQGRRIRLTTLSAGNIERFLPKSFIALFAGSVLLCISLGIVNWPALTHSVKCTAGGLGVSECLAARAEP